MSAPRVSIVMGTYNRAHFLPRAVASLGEQTFTDWELIIVDDGSADDTPAAGAALAREDSRIRYFRHDQNGGISVNYNRGFAHVRGDLVAMLDDDDSWCDPEKLGKQVQFLDRNPEYAGCGGGVVVVDPQGAERYRYRKPETDAEIRKYMLFSNPMANSTTLFRRASGESVGWYDAALRFSGDRDFWMKLGLKGKLYNFPDYFSYYTLGDNNTSIVSMRPHLRASLMLVSRYRLRYPRYPLALMFNGAQYAYAFLPRPVIRRLHVLAARLKRAAVR